MPKTDFIIDLSLLNGPPIADLAAIRDLNPQRHEMEQLSGILYENTDDLTCAGFKDVTHEEFWCRGHMPGMPVMPGVVQLEAVAQLSSYFAQKHDLLGAEMVGFGGIDEARFRDVVVPGDRLFVIIRLTRARRNRMIVADFQGVVGERLVVDGVIRGIPLPVQGVKDVLAKRAEENAI
ncbi:MAG: 3-hydroxyacyl-ACP dehydratase FabZ family protein [Planctomycetota bacterium]